jgi:Family of unknown function (DUF5990)
MSGRCFKTTLMKKQITIQLHCTHFPGIKFGDYQNVHLGVQRGDETIWETPGDATECTFDIPVDVGNNKDGSPNFLGPFVHGPVGGRFLYLVWFHKIGELKMGFRRAKINLQHLGWPTIDEAVLSEKPIEAQINLTDKKGGPVCASLKPEHINWL